MATAKLYSLTKRGGWCSSPSGFFWCSSGVLLVSFWCSSGVLLVFALSCVIFAPTHMPSSPCSLVGGLTSCERLMSHATRDMGQLSSVSRSSIETTDGESVAKCAECPRSAAVTPISHMVRHSLIDERCPSTARHVLAAVIGIV